MIVKNDSGMQAFGEQLANQLKWPFCIELVGDVGAGKTTLVKGLARGLGCTEMVSSPSFTLNNRYVLPDDRILSHYDFYRLNEAGVVSQELAEDLINPMVSVVVEWATTVTKVLPEDRQTIRIDYAADGGRKVTGA